MKTCIFCKNPLTKENQTYEDIIPNSIGGYLGSKEIICNPCNNQLGHAIDNHLAKTFSFFSTLLNIPRRRGENQQLTAIDPNTNKEYHYDSKGNFTRKIPEHSVKKNEIDNNLHLHLSAPNMKIAKQVINGLKRTYPKIEIEKFIKEAKSATDYGTLEIKHGFSFHEEVLRSISKILLEIYCLKSNYRNDLEHIIQYIKGEIPNDFIKVYDRCSNDGRPYELVNVYHSFSIIGENRGKLIGYAELFSVFKFICILSETYLGPSINYTYSVDILSRKEINLSQSVIDLDIVKNFNQPLDNTILEKDYSRLMDFIGRKKEKEKFDGFISIGFSKLLEKFPTDENPYITEEMVSYLASTVANEYAKYFAHSRKNSRNQKS